jgi:uncharacterized membrane protein
MRERLTSPAVIGWPLLVSSFGIFLIDGFPFLGGGELSGSLLARAGVILQSAVIAHVVLAMILVVARYTWLRLRFSRRRPWITIGTFFIATLVSDVVFQGAVAAGSDGTYTGASVISDVIYKTAALVLLAIVIADLKDYRQQIAALETQRRVLVAARHEATRLDALERTHVVATIAESLAEARQVVATRPPHEASRYLATLAADRVRPLSHTLSTTPVAFEAPEVTPLPQPGWRETLRRVADVPLIAPRTMAVAMTVLGFRQTVSFEADTPATRTDGSVAVTFDGGIFIESISVLAVIFLSTLAFTHLARQFVSGRLPGLKPGGQALVTTGAIVVASQVVLVVVGVSFLLPWFPESPGLEAWTPLLTVVPLMLVALTHGLIRSVSRRRAAVSSGLIAANRDLRWEIASINERLWDRRRSRATHVHGPVQAALNAAALRLRSVAGDDVDAATRDEVTQSVELLLAECAQVEDGTDSPVRVPASLAEIAELWRGVCTLEVAVDADAMQQVETDRACASALVEIVGEACTNAVRHGDAQHITLHVEILDDRVARVTLVDDGTAGSPSTAPGLGSRLLDEVTLDWSLEPVAGGTALVADLPLAPTSR